MQLLLGLREPLWLRGINQEHDAVALGRVVGPKLASCGRTARVSTTASPQREAAMRRRMRHSPVVWPPRSYVVKRILPMTSSSDAGGVAWGARVSWARTTPEAVRGQTLTRVERRSVLSHVLVLQHLQQCGLACIVQAKEQQLAALVAQACTRHAGWEQRGVHMSRPCPCVAPGPRLGQSPRPCQRSGRRTSSGTAELHCIAGETYPSSSAHSRTS